MSINTLIVRYFEQTATGKVALGTETFHDIEEALLPTVSSAQSPVFLSKHFSGAENEKVLRWKVEDVTVEAEPQPRVFTVLLSRVEQIEKIACLTYRLSHLMPGRSIKDELTKGTLVEVEYGHPMAIGRVDGAQKTNKRYPETMQRGSMPKRRLAIVLRAEPYKNKYGVVQVIPISSVPPDWGSRSAVDITSALARNNLIDYQKQSWAICNMVETVSATRIFAPRAKFSVTRIDRASFRAKKLNRSELEKLEVALAYGVTLGELLEGKDEIIRRLIKERNDCRNELQKAQAEIDLYNEFIGYTDAAVGGLGATLNEFITNKQLAASDCQRIIEAVSTP